MKKILVTALAVLAFASCSKNDDENNNTIEGQEAKMDLTISFPQTEQTKAADGNATAQDTQINTVTVFIFKSDKTAEVGNATSFELADFTINADNSYSLPESKRITTKSGNKRIYVGINLDDTEIKNATNESTFIDKANITGLYTTTAVAMLSAGQSETLKAQAINTTPTLNQVNVTVHRLVSKIAVTAGTSSETNFGGTYTYQIAPDMFTVGNTAISFFPVQQKNGSKLVTPFEVTTTPRSLVTLNPNATAAKDLTSYFYVPENTTKKFLRKEATYAVIRAKFSFSHFAQLNGETIEYTSSGTPTGDVFVVRNGDVVYFCDSDQKAMDIIGKVGSSQKYTYKYGGDGYYTFYYVFINREHATDPLALYRNQFRNITIGNIKGIGVPGKPEDPKIPTDPIVEPEDPVDGNAYIEVTINVKEWDYVSVVTDLD